MHRIKTILISIRVESTVVYLCLISRSGIIFTGLVTRGRPRRWRHAHAEGAVLLDRLFFVLLVSVGEIWTLVGCDMI